MVYWNLENAQSGTRSFHLHLQIPAISLLAHVQFRERVAANRAKRTHVGVTNAVKQSHDQSGTSPGQNLLEVHAARFTLATRARADHEIMGPTHDWINKLIHQRRDVAAVAIYKHNDVAFSRKRTNACRACAPISTRCGRHARACFTRALGCAIGAAVIDHDHFVRYTGRETFAYHAGDWFLLVKRRDNDRHVAHRKTSHARVK